MVTFEAEIEKFESNGEKTGWYYVFVSKEIAHQIKPDERKSFRVKGTLDLLSFEGLSLVPMGEGNFILPLKASLRKELKKQEGAKLKLNLTFDKDFKIEMPEDLEVCLAYEEQWLSQFLSMTKSHQNYFINWLNTAKTENTRAKRIAMIVEAMENKFDFPQMIRSKKTN